MFGITSAPEKYQQVKATGESAHKIEGQGPFSYQGEIYNLFAKIHIYWLGTMTTYKTLVQRKRKSKHWNN